MDTLCNRFTRPDSLEMLKQQFGEIRCQLVDQSSPQPQWLRRTYRGQVSADVAIKIDMLLSHDNDASDSAITLNQLSEHSHIELKVAGESHCFCMPARRQLERHSI